MSAPKNSPEALWVPRNAGKTPIDQYRRHVNRKYSLHLEDTKQLQKWSVQDPQNFWIDLYTWLKLVPALPKDLKQAYDPNVPMSSNPKWFPGLEFNYAENALFSNPDEDAIAVVGLRDDTDLSASDGETMTWKEFREQVRLTASALRHSGVKQGDRVAALVATSIWAMVLFHASASMGAIFTCISPDLGLEGCVSRLQQVASTTSLNSC